MIRLKPAGRPRAAALIMVLSSILLLSLIVSQMTQETTLTATATRNMMERAQAYQLAKGGVMLSLVRLRLVDLAKRSGLLPKADTLRDPLWTVPLMFPPPLEFLLENLGPIVDDAAINQALESFNLEGTIIARIEDERGKLNINMLPTSPRLQEEFINLLTGREEFVLLLRRKRLSPQDLMRNLIDWIDRDEVIFQSTQDERSLYDRLEVEYEVKNSPIESIDELRLIVGFDDEVIATVAPFISVSTHTYSDVINVNTAHSEVINTLWKGAVANTRTSVTRQFLKERERTTFADGNNMRFSDFATKIGIQLSDYNSNVGYESDTFRITSQGVVNGSTVTIEAIAERKSDLAITAWRVY